MKNTDLQDYVFTSKYANYLPHLKRRETWEEAVERVKQMHLRKYPYAKDLIDEAFQYYFARKVLGSQRAMQFGGTPIERVNTRIYNCAYSHCDRPRFFQEAFHNLLAGCGVGFSVQSHHIACLPELTERSGKSTIFCAPDSIEGWADSIGVLIESYMVPSSLFYGRPVGFDLSLIRPKGSPISSGSGKAPGPEPLREALSKIDSILHNAQSRKLRPIECYDIVMHASNAVLSGGVRRSATLCMFSPDDEEMLNAKTGDWVYSNPQRGRSNNSAVLVRGETTREQFARIMKSTREFGEPGFIWTPNREVGYNPCVSGDTRIATSFGLIRADDLEKDHFYDIDIFVDDRVGKDSLKKENLGTSVKTSSRVHMTKKDAEVFEIKTEHGISLKATSYHKFPVFGCEERKTLSELAIGDKLLIQSGKTCLGIGPGTFGDGFILGGVVGNGYVSLKEGEYTVGYDIWEYDFDQLELIRDMIFNMGFSQNKPNWSDQKTANVAKKRISVVAIRNRFKQLGIDNLLDIKNRVPECVWRGNSEFVKGYLNGLFFSDGSAQYSEDGRGKKATVSLRLNQSNLELLEDVQQLLLMFGVVSKIYKRRDSGKRSLPDGKGGKKDYFCKTNYDLIINRPNCITYLREIGLIGRKGDLLRKSLEQRGEDCNKPERFITKIVSIESKGREDVYCLHEPETNSFIANGIATGNCVEISMTGKTIDGRSGWQFCNLSTINGSLIEKPEDFMGACWAASVIGTLQAGYTDFPYLGSASEEITRREALLGVSITGIMESPEILFDPEIQRAGAEVVKSTNQIVAKVIGINQAARTTCVKPEGSSSAMLGTSSGIHPSHAKRYFRRVQANDNESVAQFYRSNNPEFVDRSVWSQTGTDLSLVFMAESKEGAILRGQIGAIDFLQKVKLTQNNWVEYGTNADLCFDPTIRHNVSNTVNVKPEEWDDVEDFIFNNQSHFAGISLLGSKGELDFNQAAFCEVLTSGEVVDKYGDGAILASGLIVDGLHAFGDLWVACDAVNGVVKIGQEAETSWVERAKKFANNFFEGDIQKMLYCLKEVNNFHKWCRLQSLRKPVDYTQMKEESNETNFMAEPACAGGACDLK